MLVCQHATVRKDQSRLAFLLPELPCHLCESVHAVVVSGAAEGCEAAEESYRLGWVDSREREVVAG